MVFKINLGDKGKTFKLELDSEEIIGRKIGEKIKGEELKPELHGYELEIMGTSDLAGFPGLKEVDGFALKRVLLSRGKGMRQTKPHGLRLKKSVRGNQISKFTIQINTKVVKSGAKKLEEIFPEQNKPKPKVETTQEGAK